MAVKVTVMVLKVDLQCSSCYKKIKNILCQCPKIRGQIFDVKQNTVTINVVCCSPGKVRDKLICKAGKVIKSIEIIKEKEKEREKSCEKEKEKEKERSCEKEKEKKKSCNSPPLPWPCCGPCSKGNSGGPCYQVFPVPPSCYHRYGCGCDCGCGRGYQLRKCTCVCYIEGSPSADCGCGCGRGYQLRKYVCYIEGSPSVDCGCGCGRGYHCTN